jgi:hypothetical protein
MNSMVIVSIFLERQDETGCVKLTAKQVAWLFENLRRENNLPPKGPMNDLSVQSKLGEYFRLIIDQNGAGLLKPDHNAPSIFRRKI